jgi:hypothetical protein
MIVEITNYFAKEGQAQAVLEQRRRASAIRMSLGLGPGLIFVRLEGNGPDVRWECSFASHADYEADMAIRKASADFSDARQAMHALVQKFERHLYAADTEAPHQGESALP